MMDSSTLVTIGMIVMMVLMMGGMIGAGIWALLRRRQRRDD
jgi:hypothetical protein